MPKLSIALTTYNHEDYIEEALNSVYAQKVDVDFEVVIGDDCSTDRTSEIIERFKNHHTNIRLLEYNENVGYVVNFDKTMKACDGEYIAIFDGDDIMLPGKLQKQIDFLDQHQDHVMVAHKNRSFISETGKTLRYITPKIKKPYYTIEDFIQYGNMFGNSSKMFRKSAYPEKGIDYEVNHIADWYITIMIASRGKIGYIKEHLLDYRIHSESIMKKIRGDKHFIDKMYILDQVSKIFHKKYDHLFFRQKAYAYLIRGIYHYEERQTSKARSDFMKSISISPLYGWSAYYRLFLTFLPKGINL